MDSSHVLLALEEQKKWRERRKRIHERIRQVDRRRSVLRKELDGVRNKILESAAPCPIGRWGPRPGPPFPRSSRGGEGGGPGRRHRAGGGTEAAGGGAGPRWAPEPG